MKIQIDTNTKTIKVEGKVKLSDLFDQLQKFFPDGEWEDYDIETNTTIVWENPIVIERYRPYIYPLWTTTGIERQIPIYSTGTITTINGDSNNSIINCDTTTSTAVYDATLASLQNSGTDIGHHLNQNVTPTNGIYNIELN